MLPRIDNLGSQQKEMGHKGKSMMRALYILRYAEIMSWDEPMLNCEKIKPVALAVTKLHLPEGIRQGS